MAYASPAKLRDGSWGARVSSTSVSAGDVITVKTRAGKTWNAYVSKVIWTGDDVTIVATSKDKPTGESESRRRYGRVQNSARYECDECGERVYRGSKCWETGFTH